MGKRIFVSILLLTLGVIYHISYAGSLYIIGNGAHYFWPRDLCPKIWSRDLQQIYDRGGTKVSGHYFQYNNIREALHEIQFNNRESFEKLWPSILSLKTKGAHIILRKGPSCYRKDAQFSSAVCITSGVQIIYPMIGAEPNTYSNPGIDPNLLKTILKSSRKIPEYIKIKNGQWKPFKDKLPNLKRTMGQADGIHRIRTDIILVVDGNVVDLNRIPLPKDTPIIDQRFIEYDDLNQPH